MEVLKGKFRFEASHMLPRHEGKCSNCHGHSWELIVLVRGEINQETGMVMDYGDISEIVKPLIGELDHAHLGCWKNDHCELKPSGLQKIPNFRPFPFDNPTCENILVAIGIQLRPRLRFSILELKETDGTSCRATYDEIGAEYDKWSAVRAI